MNRMLLLLAVVLLSAGCSTRMVQLKYTPQQALPAVEGAAQVGTVTVRDQRKYDPDWMGTVRGGYGNPLKTLKARDSVAAQYQQALVDALQRRGLYREADKAGLTLAVDILRLDSIYIMNQEANVETAYALTDPAGARLFENTARTHLEESAHGLGIAANMDSFQGFTEKAIYDNIGRIAGDPGLVEALRKRRSAQ